MGIWLELAELCFCWETANLIAIEIQKVFCRRKEMPFHTLKQLCMIKAGNKTKLLLPLQATVHLWKGTIFKRNDKFF